MGPHIRPLCSNPHNNPHKEGARHGTSEAPHPIIRQYEVASTANPRPSCSRHHRRITEQWISSQSPCRFGPWLPIEWKLTHNTSSQHVDIADRNSTTQALENSSPQARSRQWRRALSLVWCHTRLRAWQTAQQCRSRPHHPPQVGRTIHTRQRAHHLPALQPVQGRETRPQGPAHAHHHPHQLVRAPHSTTRNTTPTSHL